MELEIHRSTEQLEPNIKSNVKPAASVSSNYNPPISRKLMEGITGLSVTTLIKYEQEGIISPRKVKYGGMDVITYSIEDVHRVFAKRGVSFKNKRSAEVISVFSQKGGVGKSAFTQHIGSLLSLVGRTLIIDVDSQGDATMLLGQDSTQNEVMKLSDSLSPTIAELMDWTTEDGEYLDYKKLDFGQVKRSLSPYLDVVPSDLDISEINYSLNRFPLKMRTLPDGMQVPASLLMVKEVIDKIKDSYDFILFDCPPNIETMNAAVLFSSNRIICPIELEAKSLKVADRNEQLLRKLTQLTSDFPEGHRFSFEKVLLVPNKYRKENIKIQALAALQELYATKREDLNIVLSEMVIPNSTIIDKCSETKEPMFYAATKYQKDAKSSATQAKAFTDMFWFVMHEVLDKPIERFIFAESEAFVDEV